MIDHKKQEELIKFIQNELAFIEKQERNLRISKRLLVAYFVGVAVIIVLFIASSLQ